MPRFDLKSSDVRILECAQCGEPVSGRPSGERVALSCVSCGFEDERELSSSRALVDGAAAYRDRKKTRAKLRGLQVDLSKHLEDMPRTATLATLRERYLDQRRRVTEGVPEAERADAEYRLLWIGATLAAHQIQGRDWLHARALLEEVLEVVTTPAYRALVLARLARLAALSGAQELGAKWLAACPTGLRVAEVESDVRVAEALLARARGDAKAVLELVGEREAADERAFASRWLAVSLRVDAHEKLGDRGLAARLWREASRDDALVLSNTARAYGLAAGTRKGLQKRAIFVLPAFGAMVWGLLALVRAFVAEAPFEPAPLVAVVVGSVVAVVAMRV